MVSQTSTEYSKNQPFMSAEILEKYDVSGPRYTSYPTADRFVEAFTEAEYKQALNQRNLGSLALPLSVYIHIPFCESLCFFCGCNKIVTKHHERSEEYLKYLEKEIQLHIAELGGKPTVSQLHLGGGSPTFFSDIELTKLMTMLRHYFSLPAEGEFSIEIDPRTVNDSRLRYLKTLGFNRVSFGVQDFDPEVQKAVHRIQSTGQVFELVNAARNYGYDSVNVDLIYGLPKQNSASFAATLKKIVLLKPDRIALYAYAHLPERFKPQRRISAFDLPETHQKIAMLSDAISTLLDAGYVYVGMDHFALPDDALAVAKRQGRLHRNFQGYSTQPDCDMIGLGVSSIGKIGANYSQNAKTLEEYYDFLDHDRFPIMKGLALSHDDIVRRAVIMAIMCQGALIYESVELAYLIDFKKYFVHELEALKPLEQNGMITVDAYGIQVSEIGWFFVRAVAMVFDKYLQSDKNRARFSKII